MRSCANPASIRGIGLAVIVRPSGFPEAMEEAGIERRVYTAGEHKSDAGIRSSPGIEQDVARLKSSSATSTACSSARPASAAGDRAHGPPNDTLFSGRNWVAKTAKDLGLVIGSADGCVRSCANASARTSDCRRSRLSVRCSGERTPGVPALRRRGSWTRHRATWARRRGHIGLEARAIWQIWIVTAKGTCIKRLS